MSITCPLPLLKMQGKTDLAFTALNLFIPLDLCATETEQTTDRTTTKKSTTTECATLRNQKLVDIKYHCLDGLGPCELPLPDQWLSHTSASHLSQQSINPLLLSPRAANNNNNINTNNNNITNNNNFSIPQQQTQVQQQSPNNQQINQNSSNQTKIMNAVASAVACPPAASKKIRRRPENKPQSQINKCNNEKRRREQENEYIEQLGEFIHINKRDMNAPKPDKAAILNEVVKHYNKLCEKNNRKCSPTCSDSCTIHPVQQGDVSSTESHLPESSLNGSPNPDILAQFRALEHYISTFGWALIQINSDGIIETVTENIKELINFTSTDLLKQPIYSYLHPGDHAKLSPLLNNMSFQLNSWERQDDGQSAQSKRNIQKRIRMLVKHQESGTETMEQKQQRQDKYEEVVMYAAAPFNKENGDDSSPVLCLIARPEDEPSIESTMQQQQQQQQQIQTNQLEQLTFRLDTSGSILKVNHEKLRKSYAQSLTKENCRTIQDITHIQDLPRLQSHLSEVIQTKTAQSAPYRIRFGQDVYVYVKAFSQFFPNSKPNECDFIMSINTLITEAELANFDTQSVNKTTTMSLPSTSQVNSHNSNMGGPLMTSVMNGSSIVSQMQNPLNDTGLQDSSRCDTIFTSDSFEFPFTDSFDMESVGVAWDSRPDSRASVTPVSTPRPASEFSPVATVCQSPLTGYHASQPSPLQNHNNNNNNTNNNNNNMLYNNNNHMPKAPTTVSHMTTHTSNICVVSPITQQQQQQSQQQQQQTQQQQQISSASHTSSERLRNLLTNSKRQPNAIAPGGDSEQEQRAAAHHKILKGLLDADEEKDNVNNAFVNKMNVPNQTPPQQQQQQQQQQRIAGNQRPGGSDSKNDNPMLMHLLNHDDDNMDGRNNQRNSNQSELLRQLQKEETPKDHHHSMTAIGNEELIQMLRFQGNDFPNRKRSSNDSDDSPLAKRTEDKPSKLREKNKMLASLLSNPSKAPTTFTTIPVVKTIPDIPQSRLPDAQRVFQQQPSPNTTKLTPQQLMSLQQQQQQQQQQMNQRTPVQPANNQQMRKTATSMIGPTAISRPQDFHFETGTFATSTAATPIQPSGGDTELSDIVNSVIDMFPEYQGNLLSGILNPESSPSQPSQQPQNQEEMAINAITKSLMQIESTGAFNSSPPAYSMHNVNTQSQGFPPPPVYTQRRNAVGNTTNNTNTSSPQPTPAMRLQFQQQMQRDAILQQQQKERLLQQQQKQSLVVPVNATATEQLYMNSGISNYDLLNNVPPNVSLQRSANVVPDTQLSPGFSPNLLQQQLSPQQRAPFSPQPNQSIGYQSFSSSTGQNQISQQQQFSQGNQTQPQQTQPNQPQTPQTQWNTSSLQSRLSVQQQQNPMLNAQLQQSGYNNAAARQFQAQRQRSLNSPVTPNLRQNSFSEGFTEPPSPTTQNSYGPNMFNNQQMRLARQQSIPNATQHLPGSPRSYTDSAYTMMYNMHPSGTANDYYGRTQASTFIYIHSGKL
ncbi:putative uncharacterized protein DDB_G0271606 isoform X25 [Sitodiplosis mosellana]|uniref:putative uncharacterized protein DDB_G0271606 isoform X25 n=1 Tax=Sitodiplosis mosellana TaxID=263140 RepID=UPI0024446CCA|nr:putative uncharacterized protein DDB_G0271606 isoform X25 [Sitodiplosis mosellana]